jgi:hypothetical protein
VALAFTGGRIDLRSVAEAGSAPGRQKSKGLRLMVASVGFCVHGRQKNKCKSVVAAQSVCMVKERVCVRSAAVVGSVNTEDKYSHKDCGGRGLCTGRERNTNVKVCLGVQSVCIANRRTSVVIVAAVESASMGSKYRSKVWWKWTLPFMTEQSIAAPDASALRSS